MLKAILVTATFLGSLVPAMADVAPRFQPVFRALALTETVEIMRTEGLEYGASLQVDLFPDSAAQTWPAEVARIYDYDWMLETVKNGMSKALEGAELAPIIAYFEGDLGQRIIQLELAARRELIDDRVETESQQRYLDMVLEEEPRVDLLAQFVEANDLVEANVVGAMNSNFAFYKALSQGNAFGFDLTESEMIEDVWGQEQDIRAETSDWIYGYLVMAYGPLTDAEIKDYVAFSQTQAGRAVNSALFDAFDDMFVEISTRLGRAAARYMSGSDI